MNEFELGILNSIQEIFGSKFLDFLMPIITLFSEGGIFWIVIAIILLCFKKTRRIGLNISFSLLIGLILGNLFLKNAVERIRPYDLNPEFPLLIKKLSDFSFPSGHTLAAFEGAASVFLYNKKWGAPALVLAALIAFSRLYLYVHYPSDVLTSIVLGTGFALISFLIIKKFFHKV